MENTPDATAWMNNAWATRRRSLSAWDDEQEALINEAHRRLVDAVAIRRKSGERPRLAQALHLLANVEHHMGHQDAAQESWEALEGR